MKKPTKEQKAWAQGFVCAIATALQMYDDQVSAAETLRTSFMNEDQMRLHEVDESDIETMRPIIKEVEYKLAR